MQIGERDGCASCSKWFLIIFNVLFLLIGVALVGIGIYVYITMSSTFTFFSTIVNVPAVVIIVLGAVTIVITSVGCCGAIKENRAALIAFAVIVMALLIAEIVVGALAIAYHHKAEDLVHQALSESMQNYRTDPNIQMAWDDMQTTLHCCGVTDKLDWTENGYAVPTSCQSYEEGCQLLIQDKLQSKILYIGAAAIAFALAQIIGITLALCLSCRTRRGFLV